MYVIAVGVYGISQPIVGMVRGSTMKSALRRALRLASEEEEYYFSCKTNRDPEKILKHLGKFYDYEETEDEGIFLYCDWF